MARRWNRRTIVIAAIIVALSLSIVVASVPYLPHPPPPHNSINQPLNEVVDRGNQTNPGSNYFTLQLSTLENFEVGVNVTGGMATFCAITEANYLTWPADHAWSAFPFSLCKLQETTSKDILIFSPDSVGIWYMVMLNTNPNLLGIQFTPVP